MPSVEAKEKTPDLSEDCKCALISPITLTGQSLVATPARINDSNASLVAFTEGAPPRRGENIFVSLSYNVRKKASTALFSMLDPVLAATNKPSRNDSVVTGIPTLLVYNPPSTFKVSRYPDTPEISTYSSLAQNNPLIVSYVFFMSNFPHLNSLAKEIKHDFATVCLCVRFLFVSRLSSSN